MFRPLRWSRASCSGSTSSRSPERPTASSSSWKKRVFGSGSSIVSSTTTSPACDARGQGFSQRLPLHAGRGALVVVPRPRPGDASAADTVGRTRGRPHGRGRCPSAATASFRCRPPRRGSSPSRCLAAVPASSASTAWCSDARVGAEREHLRHLQLAGRRAGLIVYGQSRHVTHLPSPRAAALGDQHQPAVRARYGALHGQQVALRDPPSRPGGPVRCGARCPCARLLDALEHPGRIRRPARGGPAVRHGAVGGGTAVEAVSLLARRQSLCPCWCRRRPPYRPRRRRPPRWCRRPGRLRVAQLHFHQVAEGRHRLARPFRGRLEVARRRLGQPLHVRRASS